MLKVNSAAEGRFFVESAVKSTCWGLSLSLDLNGVKVGPDALPAVPKRMEGWIGEPAPLVQYE
jgi:hypothetical protein